MPHELAAGYRSAFGKTLEAISFYGLLAVVAASAIPYGTVELWHQSLFICLVCVFAALRVIDGFVSDDFRLADPMLLMPVLGIILLAIIQTIPFGGVISFDRFETGNFIMLLSAFVLAGETLLHYTRDERRLYAVIITVIVIGTGSALFGFMREAFSAQLDAPLSTFFSPGSGYAQFINRNHFAFLMEMTLGVLLGLQLKAELRSGWRLIIWLMLGLTGFVIISSNSRGGIMSAAGVTILAVVVHLFTRNDENEFFDGNLKTPARNRVKIAFATALLMILLFGAFVFSVAFIGGDDVVSRIEKVGGEIEAKQDNKIKRIEIWQATFDLIKNYPVAGAGFGAYGKAITTFDRTTGGRMSLQQAHNDYLELAASGGIIAVILCAMFFFVLAKRCLREFAGGERMRRAACLGAIAGIFGVLLHSIVDFGLHTTINAAIFTLLVVIAAARVARPEANKNDSGELLYLRR